jgi:hypothetical protein
MTDTIRDTLASVIRAFPFWDYGLDGVDPESEYAEWVTNLADKQREALSDTAPAPTVRPTAISITDVHLDVLRAESDQYAAADPVPVGPARMTVNTITDPALDALYTERDALADTVARAHRLATSWAVLRTHGGAAYELREALSPDTSDSPHEQAEDTPTPDPQTVMSCRSEEGITTGLIDAIIAIHRVLAARDLSPQAVQEALADLFEDPDLRTIRDARLAPAAEPGTPDLRARLGRLLLDSAGRLQPRHVADPDALITALLAELAATREPR